MAIGILLLAAAQAAPYPPSTAITGIELDWSTHRRGAQGSDNFQLAWAVDGHQYGWWGDGGGFGGSNSDGRVGLGFARVEGNADDWRGYNVWGGKNAENPARFDGKSWATIALGGTLYSWIVPDVPDTGGERDHYRYIELARSTDRGANWTKASWRWQIGDDLIIPTFLVFGRDNAGARDGYVYSYFIRPQSRTATQAGFGLNVHAPGAVYLARVPAARIFDGRSQYQWYTGAGPTWGALADKKPVFQDPSGTGWCLSAIHVPGLNRYLLATEHAASHESRMGLFDAPEPWGPWTTVRYWNAGDRFGETRPGSTLPWGHNIFFMAFAPKWFADGGAAFTLTFTGGGKGADNDSFNTVRGRFVVPSPSPSPSPTPGVDRLRLMNADTDEPLLDPLEDGAVINLGALPTRNLTVVAVATSAASVRFSFDGNADYRTENAAPYAVAGDDAGDLRPWPLSPGAHSLGATAYAGADATGAAGATRVVTFTVVDAPAVEPSPVPAPGGNANGDAWINDRCPGAQVALGSWQETLFGLIVLVAFLLRRP